MRRVLLLLAVAASLRAQPVNFVDRYSSTLASGYTSGGSTLSVTDATGLPSGTSYYFMIVRAEGSNTEEVFLVTSRSTTTLTVTGAQAGTSASNHASGAVIIGSINTATAMAQLVQKAGANTGAASMTLDMSASTASNALKAPVKAGVTTSANGAIGYDSTTDMLHAAQAGADAMIPQLTATPANGDCAKWTVSGSKYKLDTAGGACGSSSGGAPGATLFSATSSATATATSATSLIGTVTGDTSVAANTFTAGQVMEIVAQGYYSTPATPASLTLDLKIGGTTRISTGAVVQIASVTNGTWEMRCAVTTRTTGVSGTQIANCIFNGTGATLTPGEAPMQTSSAWTIDTTAAKVIDIQATWSTTTGSPTITGTTVYALIPGAPVSSVNGATGAVTVAVPSTTQGTFASLPGTCTTNDLYFFTDSLYTTARCSATNTWTYFADGKSWGLPSASFTNWNNQSTATLSETNGYSVVTVASSHSGGLAYRYLTFTALASFNHVFLFRTGTLSSGAGVNRMNPVALSDGSKCMVVTPYTNAGSGASFTITTYTDAACTAGGANPVGDATLGVVSSWFYVNVVQDGTNLTVQYGSDGNNWTQHYQASKTAFFGSGATRIGFGGYKSTATQIIQLVGYN